MSESQEVVEALRALGKRATLDEIAVPGMSQDKVATEMRKLENARLVRSRKRLRTRKTEFWLPELESNLKAPPDPGPPCRTCFLRPCNC